MAKAKDEIQELMDAMSPEDRATLMSLTGQNNGGGGTKTPVVKINFNRADVNGKKVAKGNFVLGQKSGVVDGKPATLEIGTDLGDVLEAVVLKVGTQYSYYSNDPKKRCSSQIICERGEVPTGNNLKHVCNDKSCPRRKDGIDKTERCPSQYIAFLRLPAGTKMPDGTDAPVAMMYLKGTQYMPFKDYIEKDLKGIPTIAITTKFSATEEGGAVSYWQMHFEKGTPVPATIFKENFAMVSGINNQLVEYKAEQAKKLLDSPKGSSSETSGTVTVVNGDDDVAW